MPFEKKYDIAKKDKIGLLDLQMEEAKKVIFRSELDLIIANNMLAAAKKFDREKRIVHEQTANARITEAENYITQMKLAIDSCLDMKKTIV